MATTSTIEQRSIDHIPLAERHGSPRSLLFVWFAANTSITAVVTGALFVILGNTALWAIPAGPGRGAAEIGEQRPQRLALNSVRRGQPADLEQRGHDIDRLHEILDDASLRQPHRPAQRSGRLPSPSCAPPCSTAT